MNVTKIDKSLNKRDTFICDICGCELYESAFNPVKITKTAGDSLVSATVCRKHFGIKDGQIVYSLALLKAKFEVENKAKEILVSSKQREDEQ